MPTCEFCKKIFRQKEYCLEIQEKNVKQFL